MKPPEYRLAQLKSLGLYFRHYRNPWLMLMLRLGIVRMKTFPFAIRWGNQTLQMLGRPATASMADQFTLQEVFIRGEYNDILPLIDRPSPRVVDVGANIGAFSVWLHQHYETSEIICFEPERETLKLLRANLAINEVHARIESAALGGTSRDTVIEANLQHPAATNIYAPPQHGPRPEGQSIRVIALTAWLADNPGDFDLLKLDCEAAEWEIVEQTPADAFARFKIIVAEVHADPRNLERPFNEFTKLMEDRGFTTVRSDNHMHGLYIGIRKS